MCSKRFKPRQGKGDDGWTELRGGVGVPKHDVRLEAIGTLDELIAVVGVVRSRALVCHPADEETRLQLCEILESVQHTLFSLASLVASTGKDGAEEGVLRGLAQVERWCDGLVEELQDEELSDWALPERRVGELPALLDWGRTVARRAERCIVRLRGQAILSGGAVAYLNRLSDLLFLLARRVEMDDA